MKAKACTISCIDFRFAESVSTWLKENGYLGKTDEIFVAGCLHDLILGKSHGPNLVLEQLQLSNTLHNPDEILIFDHFDCGRYAQDASIPNGLDEEADMQAHISYAQKAYVELMKHFPNKTYRFFYVSPSGITDYTDIIH